ncbi:PadR family transcriptional regulator [Anaerocolumna sp. MB42-C2]|nr:PadR family transcriptional regulator [Anaerocolumna sp. MB42-C2]WMJ90736.1 PadR family transcriptional regulator [Anaerocolumna sp. MB42-C2]
MLENKSLLSGSTSMLLLSLLSEKDMYGYEMIDTLRKRSNHVFDLKAGTLYPLLHSLEEKDYLESYEDLESAKLRKYYRITGKGRKHLKAISEEWQEYAQAVKGVIGGVTFD